MISPYSIIRFYEIIIIKQSIKSTFKQQESISIENESVYNFPTISNIC